MKHTDVKLIIFAKAPEAGKVKTRLIPALGAQAAAELHQRMTRHIIDRMQQAQLCDIEVQCYPNSQHTFFKNLLIDYCIELNRQKGSDLGERMLNAFKSAFNHYKHVVIIGTDVPAIDYQYIADAIECLKSGIDGVIGPANDGGYVLIGLNSVNAELFKGIDWGTSEVLAQTMLRAEKAHLSIQKLKSLWDVDLPADLNHISDQTEFSHLLENLNQT